MPWRNCEPTYYAPPGNGAMSFSTLSVEQDPSAACTGPIPGESSLDVCQPGTSKPAAGSPGCCPAIRDYYDFMRYTQSTQGHLNSQGLCYIDRQFPAPAGGS
jgi:hypothetical protein